MDAFEVNKTIGAVLSALLVVFGSKTMLDIVYKEHKPEKAGWALPITEVAPTAAKAPAAPFEVANSINGPPLPNVPSRWCRSICPRMRISFM